MMAHWGMLGTALAVAGLGAALGGIGGLLGIGGGLLAIPVLALLFGMEQAMAQGTRAGDDCAECAAGVLSLSPASRHFAAAGAGPGRAGHAGLLYPAARLAVTLDHLTTAMGIHCPPAGLVRLSELAGGAPAAA